ncbi:hypothetical protein BX600DRAFT_518111 [Xylariales sp. PMI_506]|nr:hypothetical protein BX600DRAFT_518111 [Xylariales sp. PMI_506]
MEFSPMVAPSQKYQELEPESTLADWVSSRCVKSLFPQNEKPHKFLPENEITDLVKKDAIKEELSRSSHPPTDELIEFVYKQARKLFLIVLQIEAPPQETMRFFSDHNISDNDLPILGLDVDEDPPVPHPFCTRKKLWGARRLSSFSDEQWKFLAPVFSNKTFTYKLQPEHIWPFTWVDNTIREGAFSKVFQVEIHAAHATGLGTGKFAIKEIEEGREGAEKDWQAEATALSEITALEHDHIIRRIAAITKGEKRYFMFEWADGGSLRDYWENNPHPRPTAELIKNTVEQFKGLTDALNELHNFNIHEGGYRHGDLKPENILRFSVQSRSSLHLGTLQISDMGTAKYHALRTEHRRKPTSAKFSTMRYEPPETKTSLGEKARSRLYDIWSLGCIMLEHIVWLLYGYDAVDRLNGSIQAAEREGQYFEVQMIEHGTRAATVHPEVIKWMDHIAADPECSGSSAIGDMLKLVRNKLLVVNLNPQRPTELNSESGGDMASKLPTIEEEHPAIAITRVGTANSTNSTSLELGGPYRATAQSVLNSLHDICNAGRGNEAYLFTGRSRSGLRSPDGTGQYLSTTAGAAAKTTMPMREGPPPPLPPPLPASSKPGPSRNNAPGQGLLPPKAKVLDKVWRFQIDNSFALKLLKNVGTSALFPRASATVKLCSRCRAIDLSSPDFLLNDEKVTLERRSEDCELCGALWKVYKRSKQTRSTKVRFDKSESHLRIHGDNIPVLSIFSSPFSPSAMPIQLGLPVLPPVGSVTHFDLLREWIFHCDHNHKCRPAEDQVTLPTRVIDVRVTQSNPSRLCLHESQDGERGRYLALSHPWGNEKEHPRFCTYRRNLAERKAKIDLAELPATFRDAVLVTRALGLDYLWIDSLCIIQGPDGDFTTEARRMENVFSSAYCVIAASSATGQCDGFLKPRDPRWHLALEQPRQRSSSREAGLLYVCDPIDDFNEDVLNGTLSKRAWVLQERALSPRTIYFTSRQTYWECGHGVRCETLTKMSNDLAAFLGDSNFPTVLMNSSRGGQIKLYQDLYMQYSRLAFSRISDRPIAIAGLEKRLLQSLHIGGAFGVFDDRQSYLNRSLLWHRGSDFDSLRPIQFPADLRAGPLPPVPSWSWMAYEGGIDYLEPPFLEVEWEKQELRAPSWPPIEGWEAEQPEQSSMVAAEEATHGGVGLFGAVPLLSAVVRDFDVPLAPNKRAVDIIYDQPDRFKSGKERSESLKCVVVGKLKKSVREEDRRHYVLIVAPRSGEPGGVYERVGAGYMTASCISSTPIGTFISIR